MKSVLFTILVMSILKLSISQENDYSWYKITSDPTNFWSDIHDYENYYKSKYPESLPEEKLGNIKDFYRFVNFWKSRMGLVDGQLSYLPYYEALNDFSLNSISSYCTESDPAEWELLGPVSYQTQSLGLVDEVLGDPNNPNSIIIGPQRGGIWKHQTSGNSWVAVTDNLRVPVLNASEIIRNKFNPNHLIASSGNNYHETYYGVGLLQSFNNGTTWEFVENFPTQDAPCANKIVQDPNDNDPSNGLTLYVITNDKLYKSENTGDTWTQIYNPLFTNFNYYLDLEIDDDGNIYITTFYKYGCNGHFYKYSSTGNWTDLNSNNQFGNFQRAMLTTPYSDKMFLLVDVQTGPDPVDQTRKIYKTTNNGATWSFITNGNNPGFKYEIEYSPLSNIVYLGHIGLSIFKDEAPYTKINVPLNEYSLHMDIRDFSFLGIINGYENVLAATDGGITLLKVNPNNLSDNSTQNLNGNFLPIGDFIGLGVNNTESEFIVSGAVHCNSFRFQNGAWERFWIYGDGGDCEINWNNPNIYYFQDNMTMYKYVNSIISSIYSINDWFIGMEYELNPNNPYLLYFGRKGKFMIYDENSDLLTTRIINSEMSKSGAIGITNNNIIYLADFEFDSETASYKLIKSINNGNTWQDLSFSNVYSNTGSLYGTLSFTLAWKTIEDIVFNPINPDELWISIGGVWREWTGLVHEKFRVLHSTNGGQTFYDYSEGLSALPLIALEYQVGSNNRLFAGTDAGVYYREPSMDQWECFSEGMPIACVTDLDYDPCSNYLYASTTGRAIYKTPVNFSNEDAGAMYPEESVWSSPKRIFYDLVIDAGTTLTIQSDVFMYCGAKITVEQGYQLPNGNWTSGGKLIIDGGTITSDCSSPWGGIYVYGNPGMHQYTIQGVCAQGQLILKNGAIVENAIHGSIAGGFLPNGNFDDTKTGGIIQVLANGSMTEPSATFYNCEWPVTIRPYQNHNPFSPNNVTSNLCSFGNARFVVDDNYYSTLWYVAFVRLKSVYGISFRGCTFENNQTYSSPVGDGISSDNSTFSVSAICNSNMLPCPDSYLDKCIFKNLTRGVFAQNLTLSSSTFSIKNAEFIDNSYGIKMNLVNNAVILFNDFILGEAAEQEKETCGEKASAYGIYTDNCTGFAIEENNFAKASGAPTGNYTGIRIANTKATDQIYNNDFEGLSYGNYSEGQNWKTNYSNLGLSYFCNDNISNYADIYVAPSSISGIQSLQGDISHSTGNKFSPTGSTWHFYNGGNHLVGYYYCQTCPGEYPETVSYVTREGVANVNRCLSHYGGGGTGGRTQLTEAELLEVEENYEQSLTDYTSVKSLYDNLKDGGNTQAMVEEVEEAWPQDMWELRAKLLGKSPHLSMEVLKEAADKTEVLPESVVFEIMAANPDELKKEELIKYLEDKENPLPQYMIDILKQVSTGTTYKTVLQQQMAKHNLEKTIAAHDIIRSILSDSVMDYNNLRNWLDNLGGMRADEEIIATYIEENNFNSAITLANMMPTFYSLSGTELNEYNYFLDVLNLTISLRQQGRIISDLDSTEIANLVIIANNSNGTAGSQAKSILESGFGYNFCKCLETEGTQGYKSSNVNLNELSKTYGFELNVEPNPAKEWTAFNYTIPDESIAGKINISDVTGKLIEILDINVNQGQLIWDTRTVANGVYFYVMEAGGFSKSGKIVISK